MALGWASVVPSAVAAAADDPPAISAAASGPATPTPREGRSRDRCVGECDDRWGIGEVWRRTPPPDK